MTQIRRRLGDYVSSKFLNSAAVVGQEGPATITAVSEEEVRDDKAEGGKRLALLVYFDRFPGTGLDLNKTNILALQDMFGEDVAPDDLRGRRVHVGTWVTPMGKGVLLSPAAHTVAEASAEARQRIANARSAQGLHPDPPPLALTHSHSPAMPCSPDACDVARARHLGHEVAESWPEGLDVIAPPELNGPPPFVPQHQPQPPAGPAATHGTSDAPPGQYHEQDPGPVAPPADDEIPF